MPIPGGAPSPLPTMLITLDDGTGTFPYDITAYVRMPEGIQIPRGRGDELSAVSPGTLTLTLDNTDARFTVGNVTYNVTNDQRIRVMTTSPVAVTLFTGYVKAWPTAWPTGGDEFSLSTITAVDVQERLQRRALSDVITEEINADSPLAHWPLGDPTGSVTAGDTSGNNVAVLQSGGVGTPVTFGSATGPGTDGLTAALFSGGQFLYGDSPTPGYTLEFTLLVPTLPAQEQGVVGANGVFNMSVTTAGNLTYTPLGGATYTTVANIADGATHHISVSLATTGDTVTLDGGGVILTIGHIAPIYFKSLVIGANNLIPNVLNGGVISHVATYSTVLSLARTQAHSKAALTGFLGDLSGSRIARMLSYAKPPQTLSGAAGLVAPGFADFTGSSIWDEIQRLVDAEAGAVAVAGDGTIRLVDKNGVIPNATPVLTVDVNQLDPGVAPTQDMQGVLNYGTGKRTNGSPQVAQDAASILAHERYPAGDLTYLVQTDAEAATRIQWRINTHAQPHPRVAALAIDVMTMTTAQQTFALTVDIASTIRVTGWPAQSVTGSSADFVVDGLTWVISATEWTLTVNATYAATLHPWILGDATYGVLGSTTKTYI